MKKLATLSTAFLSVCLIVAPLVGRASLPPDRSNDAELKSKPTSGQNDRTIYAITKTTSTGTLIPTVYRIYRGRVTTSSSRSGASYSDLAPTGSEDVGGALLRLDPSITVGPRR